MNQFFQSVGRVLLWIFAAIGGLCVMATILVETTDLGAPRDEQSDNSAPEQSPKPSAKPSRPDLSQAQAYQVIGSRDTGFAGRDRVTVTVVAPAAKTSDQLAQTAMQAAIDWQKEHRPDFVSVLLEPSAKAAGRGLAYVVADYSPDKGGVSGKDGWVWQVEATQEGALSAEDLEVLNLWYGNRSRFQTADGLTDEPALEAFISKQTGRSEVRLPFILRNAYDVGAK